MAVNPRFYGHKRLRDQLVKKLKELQDYKIAFTEKGRVLRKEGKLDQAKIIENGIAQLTTDRDVLYKEYFRRFKERQIEKEIK